MRFWLTFVAIAALTIGWPFLLFPEILSASVRPTVVFGATLAAFVMAIGLLGPSRLLRLFAGVFALTALMGWMQVPTSAPALSHVAGLGVGLLVMSIAASWCTTENRLALGVGLFLVSGLAVLAIGLVGTTVTTPYFISDESVSWLPQVELGLSGLDDNKVNPNALGGTALLVAPLGAALIFFRSRTLGAALAVRSLAGLLSIMACFVILVTHSWSTWIAVGLLLVVLILRIGARWSWRLMAVGILVTVLVAVAVSLWSLDRSGFEGFVTDAGTSAYGRIEFWSQGIEQLKSSPWLGIGLNDFRHVYERPVPWASGIGHVHNIFLQTALDLGLFGLMAYVGLVVMLLLRADQASRGPSALAGRTAAGAGLCLVAVHAFGLADAISLGAKVGVFQWLAAGLVLAAWQLQQESKKRDLSERDGFSGPGSDDAWVPLGRPGDLVRMVTGSPPPKPLTDEGRSQAARPVADLKAAGLKLALTSLGGVAAAWLAFRSTDPSLLLGSIGRADPVFVILAVASVLVTLGTVAVRWHLLLYPGEPTRRWSPLLKATVLGQMLNIVLPIRLGELARAYLVSRSEQLAATRVVLTVAIEKLADVAMLGVAMAVVLLLTLSVPAWLEGPGRALLVAGGVAALMSIALAWRGEQIGRSIERLARVVPERWRERVARQGEVARNAVGVLQTGRGLAQFWTLSVAILLLAASTNYLVFLAFDLDLPLVAALTLLVVVQAGTTAVSVPGNIGVFHYLTALTLGAFGVEWNVAVAYAVLLHVVALGPKILLGTAVLAGAPNLITWR